VYTQSTIELAAYADAERRRDEELHRFQSRLAWSDSKQGRMYTRSFTEMFTPSLLLYMNKKRKGKAGTSTNVKGYLKDTSLPVETIAYLTSKGLFNRLVLGHASELKTTAVALHIGELIHDEYRLSWFNRKKEYTRLAKRIYKDLLKKATPRHTIKRTFKLYFDKHLIDWSKWDKATKIEVGLVLLKLMSQSTGHFKIQTVNRVVNGKVRRESKIIVSDVTTAHARHYFETRVKDFQVYPVMVERPRDWTFRTLFRGCYYDMKLIRRYPLIKRSTIAHIDEYPNRGWDSIITSVNAIQSTPFRLNPSVLSVLQNLMDTYGGDIAGLPPSQDLPLPPKPLGYDDDKVIKAKHHAYIYENFHIPNRMNIGKRLQVYTMLTVAKHLVNQPTLYFPSDMDHRGRIYNKPAFLHTQGPDYMKACLEFANPYPIADIAAEKWLAVAGANAAGNDKISLEARHRWVRDNEELILSTAANPLDDLRWSSMDCPFVFLRFCLEWSEYKKVGYGFMSHMPVQLDATCSGLQHYSGMLRDDIGGRSVNLVPCLARQDIYGDVATRATERLLQIVDDETEDSYQAQRWLDFGLDRKITKRQVMVVPYAATQRSCFEYTQQAAEEKVASGVQAAWNTDGERADVEKNKRMAVKLLSNVIWASIEDVVLKGREAMEWLRTAGVKYAQYKNSKDPESSADVKALRWTTPDGFTVIHKEVTSDEHLISTTLDGDMRLRFRQDTEKLDSRSMGSSIAPNFIHSLDATQLRMAILKGLDNGITDFAMIHDSFGTHAGQMTTFLEKCIKPSFIELYKDFDPLADLRASFPEDLELPPLPRKGSLDLDGVQQSEFFFS